MTDLFGAPLVHLPGPELKNALGVVASAPGRGAAHDALCAAMRAEPRALQLLGENQPPGSQAVDLCRDLDGRPLSAAALTAALGGAAAVTACAAPEEGAFRGMMSDGVRLQLSYAADAAGGARPASLFYKRVVMGDLEAARGKARTMPQKLLRDVRSYAVEAAFLGSRACAELAAAGVPVPRAYQVELRPDEQEPIESRFALLLQASDRARPPPARPSPRPPMGPPLDLAAPPPSDLPRISASQDFSPADGWRQEGALRPPAARAALAALAQLHGYFWAGSTFWQRGGEAAAELRAAVWPAGGYGQPSMQPADQFELLAQKCAAHVASLGDEFASAPEVRVRVRVSPGYPYP